MASNNQGVKPKATRKQPASRMIRTPPQRKPQQANESVYQCDICLVTDNIGKVCCDECRLWTHFECANVTREIIMKQDHWFCRKCKEKRQEPLVSIASDTHANGQSYNLSNQNEHSGQQSISIIDQSTQPNASNTEFPVGGVTNPNASIVDATIVVDRSQTVDTSQTVVDPSTGGVNRRNSTRSHKSNSIKSTTSSAKNKSLALQRLEEEQQLRRLRDQEERTRREEERKRNEQLDKEYLDKRFNILEQTSDDSLSYDGYDDTLNLEIPVNRNEEIRMWAESVSRSQKINDAHSEDIPSQMSSTKVAPRTSQIQNPMDYPIPSKGTASSSQMPVNSLSSNNFLSLVNLATSQPDFSNPASYLINVQSTSSNAITLNRTMQTTLSQMVLQTNNLSKGQTVTSFGQSQSTVSMNPSVLQSFQQQQLQLSQSVNTNHLAPTVGYQPTHPQNSTLNSTFVVNNQPSRMAISSTRVAPSNYNIGGYSQSIPISCHQPINFQTQPSSTNYTPVISQSQQYSQWPLNHQQASLNQQFASSQPVRSYHMPIVTSYQSTSTVQPNSSIGIQHSYHMPIVTSHQSTSTVQPNSSIGIQHSYHMPFGTPIHPSMPIASNRQSNMNLNSNASMNVPRGMNLNASGAVPGNSTINTSVIQPLSREQIASRQVVSKDLPKFSGGAEDWLKFISAYENSTALCGLNNLENLKRLQDSLCDDAHDAVESLLVYPDGVPEVIRILKLLYGRPEQIIETKAQEIRELPAPKENDLASIMKFAIKVKNLSGVIKNTGELEHLQNPTLINSITKKLPAQMQLNWAYHKLSVGGADLAVLGEWLQQIAEAASSVVHSTGKSNVKKKDLLKEKSSNSSSTKSNSYVNTQVESKTTNDQKSTSEQKKCPACQNGSCTRIANCNKFKELSRDDRLAIVKNNKLCSRCLGTHHFYRCRTTYRCKVDGCEAKHHTLLHSYQRASESSNKYGKSSKSTDDRGEIKNSVNKFSSNATHSNVAMYKQVARVDIFRIVPIWVSSRRKSIKIFAFLDDGSNMTTMETSLANELQVNGTSTPICVDWAFGHRHTVDSKIISVNVSGCFNEAKKFTLENIRTVKDLHLPAQSISQSWLDQFEHLNGIPISTYESVKPRMLIGLQYSRLMVSMKTVEGKVNEPIACKTRLGWVVQGPSYQNADNPKRKYSMNICDCQSNDYNMHQLVKEYFLTENLGIKITDTMLESKDNQRARHIMESTVRKTNGRYEIGLLWKKDHVELPNSYPMALKRLQCLESKMAKDPKLAENLCNQIQQFVKKKYIRKLSPDEANVTNGSPIWYLPTFPAFNQKKPEKVRIVWDGAAKVMNISLNSMLLTGPDQLVPLPNILRRFREKLYAMIGDIKEMYHQIKVIEADQNVQRFLWRDGNSSREPDVYVMMVVTFGLTCSPSQAQFIKNKNAMEFIEEFPDAANTIINNHYVDDMIDCEHTLEAAEKRINDVKFIHEMGGFEIRNFLSNSKELLQKIGGSTNQQNKNLNISVELGTERVLGMFWNTSTDCFTFSLKFTKINQQILSGNQVPTKREVLRILMSVFDPLGLLANYLVYTKILLQNIWRTNVDWDEQINPENFKKWAEWIKTLPNVENIEIPRLYSPKLSPVPPKSVQIHTFVDASAEAYAAVVYFRFEDEDGVHCCLAGAKTKVAPNKPMSIPRLELQGAVLGVRLRNSIESSQTFKIDKKVFWTDSKTVMGWINSEARRYNQFVAFRIGEIMESAEPSEWRWVPSEQNVADEATKSKNIAKLDSTSRWYKAPKFLYEEQKYWFNEEVEYVTDEETRPSYTMACREIVRPELFDLNYFTRWERLMRAHAFAFRFIYNIRQQKKNRRTGPLSQEEIQCAENHLYRRAQLDHFLDEITVMKNNRKVPPSKFKNLEKSSTLREYSPYLDDHDVIRMDGRIEEATNVSFDTKFPIILPRRHRITYLIVDYFHRRYKHKNHSTALNEINQKYKIPALRVVMKTIRKSCQECKNLLAEPKIPEMAQLPPARLATYTLPFTYVGCDYFGPIRVRNGRKTRNRPVITEKRWILLFTCMTTRAIWMEIAHSLDTNSCIMAIDNFILRKGQPREIYSDNGSSFHSSDKELMEEFGKMEQDKIEEKFTNSTTIWKFNPPATPHMGGVWERLIGTVKSCLKQTMLTRCPNDEMLKNLIVEAEFIVNSRPLTYVSLESADDEALTPNHILLGSSNGIKPLGKVIDKDIARNTYKAVQVLANNFWHRFVLEYMPTLTKRTKWFDKVEPIKVGDVVVVVDERNERNTWPKGIVEELLPGKKGIVRQVMVRTTKGMRRRSVGKLAVLDVKPPSQVAVKQLMGPVNGEGNVGQHCANDNTDLLQKHSATKLPDSSATH